MRVAVPAVLGPLAIFHFALVGDSVARGTRFVEKILHEVDSVVEEVRIGGADVKMDLALELGAQLIPVTLQNGVQVIVIVPVGGNLMIDDPSLLVENLRRIPVSARRA